jgi:hypothetical protein
MISDLLTSTIPDRTISGKTLAALYMARDAINQGYRHQFLSIEHADGTITHHEGWEIPALIAQAERQRVPKRKLTGSLTVDFPGLFRRF